MSGCASPSLVSLFARALVSEAEKQRVLQVVGRSGFESIEDFRSVDVSLIDGLETLSPLLSCSPVPASTDNGHATYEVLRIGEDVIVPATGVRGALRNLMTILAGGSLSYLDDEVWLCQGRDARLVGFSVIIPHHTCAARGPRRDDASSIQ